MVSAAQMFSALIKFFFRSGLVSHIGCLFSFFNKGSPIKELFLIFTTAFLKS